MCAHNRGFTGRLRHCIVRVPTALGKLFRHCSMQEPPLLLDLHVLRRRFTLVPTLLVLSCCSKQERVLMIAIILATLQWVLLAQEHIAVTQCSEAS
mmetsp:Transcript_126319/g.252398  ORF Transcript_126319/g.252398 Transcript_126319/m.252398 type:complete len:96 (+) Transcript_126319:406-693(+)